MKHSGGPSDEWPATVHVFRVSSFLVTGIASRSLSLSLSHISNRYHETLTLISLSRFRNSLWRRRGIIDLSMTNLRAVICRPHVVFLSSFLGRRRPSRLGFSFHIPYSVVSSPSVFSPCLDPIDVTRFDPSPRFNPKRTIARASKWDSEKSPYETLGICLKSFLMLENSQFSSGIDDI